MFDPPRAIALIKQVGVYGLNGSDGCACTSFSVHGMDIEISCRKSAHLVRVTSYSCDSIGIDLQPVADAVLADLTAYLGYDAITEGGYRVALDIPSGK